MWIPKPRELSPPDTIPLHPQTAGRNPDIMLIARSKSKSRYFGTSGMAIRRGKCIVSMGYFLPARESRFILLDVTMQSCT
jgi:hypothetical protein